MAARSAESGNLVLSRVVSAFMPAAPGATQIPISPLAAPLPEGAVLNFPQGKAILNSAAAAGTISLEVKPLTTALPSGAQVTWGGEIILHHDIYTCITLQHPLSGAIPSGTVLEFPSGRVILARDAPAGAIALYVHPTNPPLVGATTTFTPEVLQPPYMRKQLMCGGTRTGGQMRLYPYSLVVPDKSLQGGTKSSGLLTFGLLGGTKAGGMLAAGLLGGTLTGGLMTKNPVYLIGGTKTSGVMGSPVVTPPLRLLGSDGMTQIFNGNSDDDNVNAGDIGFDFPFYDGVYRNNIFVGSNGYVTFGFGSNQYNNITVSAPGRGVFVRAADRSYQKVFVKQDKPGQWFRIRYEGSTGTSGTSGSPTMLWELTLLSNGNLQLVTGILGDASGSSFLTSGNTVYNTPFTPVNNSSYLFTRVSANQYTYTEG